jgi:cytochrome c oxidase subunit II
MTELPQTWRPAPGSSAALIHDLSLAMYLGGALIFLGVMALLLRAVFSRPRAVVERRWLLGGGIVFPGLVLAALMVFSLGVAGAVAEADGRGAWRFLLDCMSRGTSAIRDAVSRDAPVRVRVIARQWWWEVRYSGATSAVLANELHVPAGRRVEVFLETTDVIHSFWVPTLAGKVDMIPGRGNVVTLRAATPGEHHGLCAEYCGAQHARMLFRVVVEPEAEFARWLARQSQPVARPGDPFLRRGHDTFFAAGCASCHAVRGTAARGTGGPDLTHVGGRRTLAAMTLTNHVGTMAGWIAAPQDLKPGSSMPDTRGPSGEELRALATWLRSLE